MNILSISSFCKRKNLIISNLKGTRNKGKGIVIIKNYWQIYWNDGIDAPPESLFLGFNNIKWDHSKKDGRVKSISISEANAIGLTATRSVYAISHSAW